MTTTAFTHTSPAAVRCSDCQHSPGRHKSTCQTAHRIIYGLGYWRKCDQYQYGPQPKPAKPKPRVQCRSCQHRPKPVKNPCEPAGVYMTITGIDKWRLCDHWQPRLYRRAPEIRYVAKEHVEAALANNPGANVITFRPRGEA